MFFTSVISQIHKKLEDDMWFIFSRLSKRTFHDYHCHIFALIFCCTSKWK